MLRMQNYRRMAVKTVFFLAMLGICAALFRTDVRAAEEKIKKGVRIGSVEVGGMTREEAEKALKKLGKKLKKTTFKLKSDQGGISLSGEEMGAKLDASASVDQAIKTGTTGTLIDRFKEEKELEEKGHDLKPVITLDRQKTAEKIYEDRESLGTQAEDNRIVRENGSFTFVEGKSGIEVDEVESVYAIEDALLKWSPKAGKEIRLVTRTAEPRGSREELEQIQDVLGSFSTDYGSSGYQRATNVENGVSKINKTILYPGEEFSVYETVSPFTKENGYELAGSYANGTTVESFGGGICQVSTTLYNAVIRAELEVLKRFNHSMAVAYVKPSEDAAIAGTYKDFRFRNNLDTPIYIQGYCEGGMVYFNIYGKETRPANREVSFESEVLKEIEPKTRVEYSGEHDVGYVETTQGSHTGYEAQLMKIVTVDGKEQSREVFNRSTYDASPIVITVGTRGASEAQMAAINSAAGSESASKIREAVSSAPGKKDDEEKKENKDPDEENPDKKDKDEKDESKKSSGEDDQDSKKKKDTSGDDQESEDQKGSKSDKSGKKETTVENGDEKSHTGDNNEGTEGNGSDGSASDEDGQ